MIRYGVACCAILMGAVFLVQAQPIPVGDAISVAVDTVGNQSEPTVAVNHDGVIFVCYETPGRVNPGNRDLVAVVSGDFENWTETVIVSRDSTDEDPKCDADPVTGNFGVTWYQDDDAGADAFADGDDMGQFFRIVEADGTPVTDVRSVSDDKTPRGAGGQGWGSCAFNPVNGNLYVMNEDWGGGDSGVPSPDGDGDAQVLRVFDGSTGDQIGPVVLVNTDGVGNQDDGFIAFAGDGSFVAVWREYGGDDRIWYQKFDADLNKIGPEVDPTVESQVAFFVQDPDIGGSADGKYVIVVTETTDQSDGSGKGVYFNLYNPDGTPIRSDVLVNENFEGDQSDSEVAMDSTGRFVIVWEDATFDGDGRAVMCRPFNPDGTPAGPEMMVNQLTNGNQQDPTVAIVPPDVAAQVGFDFVVAFEDGAGNDGDGNGIYVRRFAFEEIAAVDQWMLN